MFKQLQELNVAFNKGFDDTSMEILGIHCRDLRQKAVSTTFQNNSSILNYYFLKYRILNIRNCNVTDSGIEALCGGPSEEEQKKLQGGRGQCKSIENLLISENDILIWGFNRPLEICLT